MMYDDTRKTDVETLITVRDARLHYRVGGALSAMVGSGGTVKAVDGVSFTLKRGESVGLLGESGCGKTSMGRLLVKLEEATAGELLFDGADIGALEGDDLRKFRTRAQLIFQNPFDSFNPRYTIRQSMVEPLTNARIARDEWEDRIIAALELVRLPESQQYLDRAGLDA